MAPFAPEGLNNQREFCALKSSNDAALSPPQDSSRNLATRNCLQISVYARCGLTWVTVPSCSVIISLTSPSWVVTRPQKDQNTGHSHRYHDHHPCTTCTGRFRLATPPTLHAYRASWIAPKIKPCNCQPRVSLTVASAVKFQTLKSSTLVPGRRC